MLCACCCSAVRPPAASVAAAAAAAGFYKAAEGLGCQAPSSAGAQLAHEAGDAADDNNLICAAWAGLGWGVLRLR